MPRLSGSNDAIFVDSILDKSDAEYIVFKLPGKKKEKKRFREALVSGDFGVMHRRGPFVMAKRGHPTDRNDRVLERLER